MDSAELAEWRAFYALEPFGEWVADQRFGEMAALTANINRDPKKRPEAYRAADFVYWRGAQEARQPQRAVSAEEQSKLVTQTLFGAVIAKAHKPRK